MGYISLLTLQFQSLKLYIQLLKKRLLELNQVTLLSLLYLSFLIDSLFQIFLLFSLFCFNFCETYIHFKINLIIIIEVMKNKDFITPEGLNQLKNYKYKPGKYTIIDGWLNPYWQWFVKLLPEWLAPNLITFIGWVFVIISYVNILRYDYTFQQTIPNWCFLLAAACTWIYSTLDAVDGKQARRTKSSSPLGQLFDHGCDSFSLTFFVLALSQAGKLDGGQVFVLFITTQSAMYFANWGEYNTGVLKTNVGQFGVTQAQLIAMIIHIITGIFGQQFWQIKIRDVLPLTITEISNHQFYQWTLNLKLGGFTAYYFGGLIFFSCLILFLSTIISSQDRIKPMRECCSLYLVTLLVVIWFYSSLYDRFKGLILLNFGLLFSLLNCKVIISSVTKMSLPYMNDQIMPTIMGTVSIIVCQYFGLQDTMQYVFWSVFGANVFIILNFLTRVISQITAFLGIYCFSLKKRTTETKQQ